MAKKRKYLKVRAHDVDLAGEPLPDWVAAPGGFATLGTTGKLESSQLPSVTNLTSLGLVEGSDIDNLPYIGQGLITYKLLNVTYKGTFPTGMPGSSLNGSVLNQYSWSDQVVYQELCIYINQNNTKCYRQKYSGVWTGWATVMNTSKANVPYGFPQLDANRKIGLNFVPSEVCPSGFIGISANNITPSLYNGLLGNVHNVLEQVINESNIVGFEKSTDLTNWTTVTPAKSIIYLIRGNKRLEQPFLATESCRITIGNTPNQCNFKAIEFGITNGGLGFKVKVEGIKNGSSTYTTIYDNSIYEPYVVTFPGNLFLNLNESVTVHPSETVTSAYNSIRITLVCVNTKTSNNWYLNFIRWYGGYPFVKEPVTFLDSKLSEDTDGHISFPHGVRAQFFDGRATGLGKDVVSSTNVRDVYNAATVSQLTNYKLTALVGAENLPPTFTNGNGAFLLVNRYDVSSGYMIICNHIKEDGIWICYKKPGTDGFSQWIRLDNEIQPTISSYANNADLHDAYAGCPVGLTSVNCGPSMVTNIPPNLITAANCSMMVNKASAENGNVIFIDNVNSKLWVKYYRNSVWKEWNEIGNSGNANTLSLKSTKCIVGVVTEAFNGVSEYDLNQIKDPRSPAIEDTDEGDLVLTTFDSTYGSDSKCALFMRYADGKFYRVLDSIALKEVWLFDQSGGCWWVDPGKNVNYCSNIKEPVIVADYSKLKSSTDGIQENEKLNGLLLYRPNASVTIKLPAGSYTIHPKGGGEDIQISTLTDIQFAAIVDTFNNGKRQLSALNVPLRETDKTYIVSVTFANIGVANSMINAIFSEM